MISQKLFSIFLFFAMALISLQILSGIYLFIEKFGIFPSDVLKYFIGDQENFFMPKSFEGLLETAVPHFIAISTTIFVFAHFLLFTNIISQKKKMILITILFISSLIDIFSPLGIIYGFEIFAWIKIFSFFIFEISFGVLLYILFRASFKNV